MPGNANPTNPVSENGSNTYFELAHNLALDEDLIVMIIISSSFKHSHLPYISFSRSIAKLMCLLNCRHPTRRMKQPIGLLFFLLISNFYFFLVLKVKNKSLLKSHIFNCKAHSQNNRAHTAFALQRELTISLASYTIPQVWKSSGLVSEAVFNTKLFTLPGKFNASFVRN